MPLATFRARQNTICIHARNGVQLQYMYKRLLNPLLSKSFFVFGGRSTGKSTLLHGLFADKKTLWIDLLDDRTFREYSDRPELLNERIDGGKEVEWVVIDEVQKIPALLDTIHQIIFKKKQKFALTGSSARKLKRGGANLLAGRALVYHLYPLTFVEMGDDFDLFETLQYGSLPEILNATSKDERQETLRAYANTYLREEILIEQLVRNVAPFRRFLEVAAHCNGQIINYAKIGRDCGVDGTAIERYFQILEDTHVGFMLQPFHQSIRKRQAQKPKFYFFDLGVRRFLEGLITFPVVEGNFQFGKIFEHFIILEIMRLAEYYKKDFRLSFLMTKENAEIDLIVERPGQKTLAIEIKSSKLVDDVEISKLQRLGGDLKNSDSVIISRETTPRRVGSVSIKPWREGILSIFE